MQRAPGTDSRLANGAGLVSWGRGGPHLLQGLDLLAVALREEDQAVAIAQVGIRQEG